MAPAEASAFGLLLKRYRISSGLTHEELASRSFLSARAIDDIEAGVGHAAEDNAVEQLIAALELSSADEAALREAASIQAAPADRVARESPDTSLPTQAQNPSNSNTVRKRGMAAAEILERPGLLPSELRVFMFADVRGYTAFTHDRGDEAAARLAAKLAVLAREVAGAAGGEVIEMSGDEVLAVFTSARQALKAAVELQKRLSETSDSLLPLPCGIGLDAGEAITFEAGYRGGALNLGRRLSSLAGAGEVLASEGVVHLARKTDGLRYVERGMVQLKGLADPVRVMHIVSESSSSQSPKEEPQPAAPQMPIGGFLGALPTGLLIARDAELDKVLKAVDAVTGGAGRLIVLAGEPGIGKTRLAQEVSLALRDRGFLTACGRCYDPHRSTPYYPFLEALAGVYVAAPPSIRAAAAHRWPYLGRLLPDQLGSSPAGSSDGQEDQQRLFGAVASFLVEVAGTAPVALLLDDLHWADGASLQLLQHLARHTRAYPVLLLGTYRDTEVERGHPLKRTLLDLSREQLVERVTMSRLGAEGTAALMEASFGETDMSAEFASLVHRHTDGNPFFVHEVLRSLVERGHVFRRHGRWERENIQAIEVPESVRAAIEERVSRLAEGTQAALYDASVLGQTFTFEELQALEGLPESKLDHALTEATRDGLVRDVGADGFAFNHALTQQSLYAELSTHRKQKLHLLAGEALERLPERARSRRFPELAWHFLEGGDTPRALTYSVLAGDQASAVFAHSEAEQFYRKALQLFIALHGDPDPAARAPGSGVRADILLKLGDVLRQSVRYDEALVCLEQAAATYEAAGDAGSALGVIARIGSVHHVRGTWAEGIARVQAVLPPLQERRGRGIPLPLEEAINEAAIYISLAHLSMKEGKYGASLAAIAQARELASDAGDNRILAQIEAVRGDALRLLGRPSEALTALEHSIDLTRSLGDDDTLFLALDSLAEMYLLNGDLERCKERRERAVEVAERTGDRAKVAFETVQLGYVSFYIGSWSGATDHFEQALQLARSLGLRLTSAGALFGLGMGKLAEGQKDVARRYLEEGIDICIDANNSEMLSIGCASYAEMELLEGRPQVGRERLAEVLRLPGMSKPAMSSLLPILAWCHLEAGDEGEADRLVTKAMEEASEQQNKLALLEALRVRGMLLARQQRLDEGAQVLGEAVSLARAMPFPYNVARILRELGDIELHRGNSERAYQHLEEASGIFRRLGALRDTENLAAVIAQANSRVTG
jgi:class 3 adenylate cyclase/tetratricopeptide (TPR) repeat protein